MIVKNIKLEELKDLLNEYKENYDVVISDFTKIYGYKINNIFVGFIIFNIMYEKCEIVDIYVCKNHRRNNIAYNLINEITKDYKIENISLEVSENNINAINLYKKLDFKKVATRKNYYKDSDGILMVKEVR